MATTRSTKLFLCLVMSGAVVMGSARFLSAATATGTMPINATVSANCTVTTTAVTFPAPYDPVVANAGANEDGTGNVQIVCTKGAGTSIALNLGANALVNQPRMKGPGAADFLAYMLYSDSGRTVLWSGVTRAIAVATSKAAQNFVVYARIPSGQDVSVGTYLDTVTVTLNY